MTPAPKTDPTFPPLTRTDLAALVAEAQDHVTADEAPHLTFTAWLRFTRRDRWTALPDAFPTKCDAITTALANLRSHGLTYGDVLILPAGERPGR